MRVLLTNNTLGARAGSELYLRDVAVELMRRGHRPVAYSTELGDVAAELEAATVPVIRSLDSLGEPPDIIHGQHHYETLTALLRFTRVPAISYCHGWLPWQEAPLRFPRIFRYIAVDEVCRERLITEGGIEPGRIRLLLNFFDQRKFPPRNPLPDTPRLALVFSNTFSEGSGLQILREACAYHGIELHAVGLATLKSESDPGRLLQRYDVVFAKARAAIEAMAVGCAVVLCNPGRLGPMVTLSNFRKLRPLNFGIRTLDRSLDVDTLAAELGNYCADDAAQVRDIVRSECQLDTVVDNLLGLYRQVIEEANQQVVDASAEAEHATARYLELHSDRYKGREYLRDRELLVHRCNEVEEDRRRWIQKYSETEEDRIRWTQRCSDAETNRNRLAAESSRHCVESDNAKDLAIEQLRAAEAERGRLEALCIDRGRALADALEALQQNEHRAEATYRRCQASEQEWKQRYEEASETLRLLRQEFENMQNWAVWRITKRALECFPMRRFVRPAIRAIRPYLFFDAEPPA